MAKENQTLPEFLLLGFSDLRALQGPLFWGALLVYLVTLLGNSLIILLTQASPTLHSPMYFFLRHLSLVELLYTTDLVPRTLADLASPHPCAISFWGCAAQMYVFIVLGISECCLLTAMAYDRYAAICQPLHYSTLMSWRACMAMVGLSWLMGIITATTHSSLIFTLPFPRRPVIPHFLCEIQAVLQLVCGNTSLNELQIILAAALLILCPFGLILGSYGRIMATIFRIPSAAGRIKAFSTCSSHLVVVSLFYGTAIFIYIRPKASYDPASDPLVSLFYAVVTPILNPIIYSLRNADVKAALKRTIKKMGPAEI